MVKSISKSNSSGFTIIELLIATLVFSTILLIATMGVIQIGRVYVKGYIGSETQNTARSVVDQLSQAIQLSGKGSIVTATQGAYQVLCIGPVRYTYVLNEQLGSTSNSYVHALVKDTPTGGNSPCVPNPSFTSSGGTELLSTNERLVTLSINPVGVCSGTGGGCLYQINLGILYGNNSVTVGNPPSNCATYTAGGSFCGLETTSTTVQQRS